MKHAQPTHEQMAAIERFAKHNGRNWKTLLWSAWMNGNYHRYVIENDGDDALLQQVRNQFGPTWLDKLRLPKSL